MVTGKNELAGVRHLMQGGVMPEKDQDRADKLAEALRLMIDALRVGDDEGLIEHSEDFRFARAALAEHEAARASQLKGEAVELNPIARRRVFDAIAGAYDLGYADRKAGRIGAAKEVEIDHGGALIASLEKALVQPARRELTDAELDALMPIPSAAKVYSGEDYFARVWDDEAVRHAMRAALAKFGGGK